MYGQNRATYYYYAFINVNLTFYSTNKKYLCDSNFEVCFWNAFFKGVILIIPLGNHLKWPLINVAIVFGNINFELLIIGCNQARYERRGTCLECLPPLVKSFATLGKDCPEVFWDKNAL